MSYEKQSFQITGYQQTGFMPTHQPQPQAPEIYPNLPAAAEPVSPPSSKEIEEDAKSEQGLGEPGYIPDAALNFDFDACFHEHESTRTFKGLYTALGFIYKYTKLVVYHVFVILIGIPMAILWAILNGLFVFIHVWIYLPIMKITVFWVYAFAPLVAAPIQAVFTPLVDVSARIFRQIRVKATLNGNIADKLVGHSHTV